MANSNNSQIEKLLELKQLFEAGVLTKEEMEAEKKKILGTNSEAPKESQETDVPLSHTTQKEQIEAFEQSESEAIETSDDTFFEKNKKYIFGGIALLFVVAGIFIIPKIISHSESVTIPSSDTKDVVQNIILKGVIGDNIGFSMHLQRMGSKIEGTEHYESQKSDAFISIKGTIDDNGVMILDEYDGGVRAGSFNGNLGEVSYSGSFTNSKGKTFPFSANIVTESELARIEKEEKQFETTKIVYEKITSSAIVELSADYPIKGADALLQNTRKYIKEVIANMFQIEGYEYKGSLNDGNSVINSYGKAKFDELDRERKENAYEGASAYVETIEFTKDFENENCVSLCAHSYYFHGGVSNEFCDASTFRKVDGKHINIIRSNNDKGLHKLIINAVKNKLGEDYESVNEEFESSPVAGIIHLVKDGVQFDYQHYEIGPGYLRQVSITIPYDKIKPYMTEEAKNVLEK